MSTERRLIALSEEEVERLRDVAHDLADGFDQGVDTDPKYAATLTAISDRYEEGIDGAECHEMFSLAIAHGMRPPEIHPGHPAYTGFQKLAQYGDENHPRYNTPLTHPDTPGGHE